MKQPILALSLFMFSSSLLAGDPSEFDDYGGYLGISGEKTGWFHVQEIGGRWYFVTPEGHAFFSLGATHANNCISKDELGLFESKYDKSEEKLSEFILSQFQTWGYNSSGYGSLEPMEKRLPYAAVLWIEGPMSLAAGTKTSFADVFDPGVQDRIRSTIRTLIERHINNRNCLGYYFLDIPTWHTQFNRTKPGGSYVDFIRALEPQSAGSKAYVAFLKKRYNGDIAAFNKAYSLNANSFDELVLKDITAKATDSEIIAADDELFLNEIAETYFSVAAAEVRRLDPNHLILGDRFMADSAKTHDSILKTAAKYVDVISFQPMGTHNLLGAYIDKVHALTGKPVLLGDVNCVLERPAKDLVDTEPYERAVGEHTQAYYLDAASRPSLIGIHRCTIRDYQSWNMQFFRRGLLKADDTPYPLMSEYTRRVSASVFDMVYGSAPQE